MEVWKATQHGLFPIKFANKDGVTIPKPEENWDTKDEKKYS